MNLGAIPSRDFEAPAAATGFNNDIALDGTDLIARQREGVDTRVEAQDFRLELQSAGAESAKTMEVVRLETGGGGVGAAE